MNFISLQGSRQSFGYAAKGWHSRMGPIIIAMTIGLATTIWAEPVKVLFIGNSFTYFNTGIDTVINNLSAPLPVQIDAYRKTNSGWTLEQHFNDQPTHDAILQRQNDFVVLQEHTYGTYTDEQRYRTYTALLDSVVKTTGAQSVLFLTWPYLVPEAGMIDQIAAAVISNGIELNAPVAPIGLAWQQMLDETDIDLYADDRHPSFVGTYLAACIFYATFTGESPVGATWHGDLSQENADYVQQLAWSTYETFAKRPFTVPGTFEAEHFTDMQGGVSEPCSDENSGRDMGFNDAGDWYTYLINVQESGTYLFEGRVASLEGNGKLSFYVNEPGNVIASTTIPKTDGWQIWETVQCTLSLDYGQQTLGLFIDEAGFNINQLTLTLLNNTIEIHQSVKKGVTCTNLLGATAQVKLYTLSGRLVAQQQSTTTGFIYEEWRKDLGIGEGLYILTVSETGNVLGRSIVGTNSIR